MPVAAWRDSGDLMLCFATGNRGLGATEGRVAVELLPNETLDPLFWATIESTEEAIVNALLGAETTSGREGRVVHRLDPAALAEVMRRYGRL